MQKIILPATIKKYHIHHFLAGSFFFLLTIYLLTIAIRITSPSPSSNEWLEVKNVSYLIDQDRSLSIDNMSHSSQLLWKKAEPRMTWKTNTPPLWIKVTLKNNHPSIRQWIFDTGYPFAKSATIHQKISSDKSHPTNSPEYKLLFKNFNDQYFSTPYFTRNPAALVSVEPGEETTIYLNFEPRRAVLLDIKTFKLENALKRQSEVNFLISSFIGILCTLAFVNFLFFFSLKKSYFLFYCFQELSIASIFILDKGIALEFFIPGNLTLNSQLTTMSIAGMGLFSLLFARSFLELNHDLPKLHALIASLAALFFICFLLSLFPATLSFTPIILLNLMLLHPVAISIAGVASCFKRGIAYAGYFTLSWALLVIATFAYAFCRWNLTETDTIFHSTVMLIGYTMEGVILSLAMALRVSAVRKSTIENNQKLISILRERSNEVVNILSTDEEVRAANAERISSAEKFASASHDINHSLFSIKLHLDQFRNDHTETREIETITSTVDQLRESTSKAIDKVRSDYQSFERTINIENLFNDITESISKQNKNKGLEIRVKTRNLYLDGSEVIIKRVLENITKTATDTTHNGGMIYTIRNYKNNILLQISTTDDGYYATKVIEINESLQEGSFDNSHLTDELTIAAHLCKQAGYHLSLNSVSGRGTTYTLSIPI